MHFLASTIKPPEVNTTTIPPVIPPALTLSPHGTLMRRQALPASQEADPLFSPSPQLLITSSFTLQPIHRSSRTMSSPIPAPHATPPRLRRDVSPPVTPDRPRLPAQIHLHRAASRRAMYAQRLAEHEHRPRMPRIDFVRSVEQEYMATVGLRDWHECLIPVDIHLEPEVRVALPARLTEIPVTLPVIVGPVGRLWRVWSVMKGAFRLVWGRAGGVMGFVFRLWINGCAFARERSMGEGK